MTKKNFSFSICLIGIFKRMKPLYLSLFLSLQKYYVLRNLFIKNHLNTMLNTIKSFLDVRWFFGLKKSKTYFFMEIPSKKSCMKSRGMLLTAWNPSRTLNGHSLKDLFSIPSSYVSGDHLFKTSSPVSSCRS